MADFSFEREVRTPYSEAYLVMESDRQVGRVDIHFTPEMVHVAVTVDESLTQDTVRQIIDTLDEDIVDAVGINRGNFVVHVFQGRETGVFSDENEVTAQLSPVAGRMMVAPPPGEMLHVGPDGPRREYLQQVALGQAVGAINVALRVRQDGEGQLKLTGKLEQPLPGLEGNGHHFGTFGLNLAVLLPQLRQMFPSRHSSEVPQEDQQYLPAQQLLEGEKCAIWRG